ncbi:MAG: PqiC family protein [Rhizomicrobium sp.]
MKARMAMILASAILVAGCGSSPQTHFFVLDEVAGPHVAVAKPVQVVAVHIPPDLDRQEMVKEQAPDRLEVSSPNRWGAPFDEMVQLVLTQDLAARLPAHEVVFPNEPAPSNTLKLVVDILAFGSDPSGQVKFDGSWALVPTGSDQPSMDQHLQLVEAGGPDYASQAAAMSRVLGHLADRIAASLRRS